MRACVVLGVFTAVVAATWLSAAPPAAAETLAVGHRGGHKLPENTLINYDFALNVGTDVLEIDVWNSADGVPVCIHDPTVDRTTDGTGLVVEKTLAELKALDAGSWLDPMYAGERIPTLEEALTLIKGRGGVLLDIKDKSFIPAIAQVVADVDFPQTDLAAWIRSFAPYHVTDAMPDVSILMAANSPGFDEEKIYQSAIDGHLGLIRVWESFDTAYLDLAHAYGLLAFASAVPGSDYSLGVSMGADGLIVSRPDVLVPLLPGPVPACKDGIDNDGDLAIDYPDDSSCFGPQDPDEYAECSNKVDDDGDGAVDYPADPGCFAAFSPIEAPACDNGIDDNGDGAIDHPDDPGCFARFAQTEGWKCQNGLDDDSDGNVDWPDDPGCLSASDDSEEMDCNDGLDNDGDGYFDWPRDPGCTSPGAPDEREACRNGKDDDGDGLVDFPDDPDCLDETYRSEFPACMDGFDNDGDLRIDFPDDPECDRPDEPSERPDCNDGVDNDLDGFVDFPADVGCGSAEDRLETDDNDADGIADRQDDCFDVANPEQCDTDQDGYGNACDADYNDDGVVGLPDFSWFRQHVIFSAGDPDFDPDTDHDCDGFVGVTDFNFFRQALSRPPGPSGLWCAGSPPCSP